MTDCLKDKKYILTIEENSVKGGVGEEILSFIIDQNICCKFKKYGLPDYFVEHGSISELRNQIGLTAEKIFKQINIEWLKKD
jgi:1-deoxy-D-xylulose-5-phosphate synthase